MTKETFKPFDAADYLNSAEAIAAYLAAAAEGGDDGHFARALGTVARTRNMSALARETGLTRQGLHKALSADGKPSLETAMRVLSALGLQFSIAKSAERASKPARKAGKPAKRVPVGAKAGAKAGARTQVRRAG